jgi:hypothetical protein
MCIRRWLKYFTEDQGNVNVFRTAATIMLLVGHNAILVILNVHHVEKISAGCQTESEISSPPDSKNQNGTENGSRAIGDRKVHDDLESSDVSLISLDDCDEGALVKKLADSVTTVSNTGSASKQKSDSSLKKTPYGKFNHFNCHVIVPRLTDAMICTLISPLASLPKIPFKTYMQQKPKADQRSPSAESSKKQPVALHSLTVGNLSRNPSQSKASSTALGKRSVSPTHEQQRKKQVKSSQSREMFRQLARTIESLADADPNLDPMIGHDDIQTWCFNKALRAMENSKHRSSERSLGSQNK